MSSHIAVSNEVFDLRVEPASTHLICGPSNSGKTVKVANILKHKDSYIKGGSNIKNIVFCYAAWQEIYSELDSNGIVSKWVNKMPTNEQFIELVSDHKEDGSIVILDDFMQDISRDLVQIVCVSSRHYNTTTFILFQSLFPAHPLARQISLNVKYIYLLKNPREKNQVWQIYIYIYIYIKLFIILTDTGTCTPTLTRRSPMACGRIS